MLCGMQRGMATTGKGNERLDDVSCLCVDCGHWWCDCGLLFNPQAGSPLDLFPPPAWRYPLERGSEKKPVYKPVYILRQNLKWRMNCRVLVPPASTK